MPEVTTERLLSMKMMETASKEWTIQKMKRLKSSHRLLSTQLEKQQSLETSIDSMFTITIQSDLNGMRSAVNILKTTTLLLLLLGNKIHLKLDLVPFAVQSMSLMFA